MCVAVMMLTLDKFIIPENTKFEEGSIVVDGDAIICPGSSISYGITARKVIIGEKVRIEGDVVGEEVRIDSWCTVKGNVVSKGETYIADFVNVEGKLTVFGDLDIGRNVKIKEGFEARGLITIQDPLPVIIFVFFYLLELLRLGKLEEAEKLFEELEDEDIKNPLVIPENTVINLNKIQTEANIVITKSRVLGNIRAKRAEIEDSDVFGSVRCKSLEDCEESGVILIKNSKVHGAVEGKVVIVLRGSEVVGKIDAENVYVEEDCVVEGTITGKAGVIIKPAINVQEILNNLRSLNEKRDKRSEGLKPTEVDGLNKQFAEDTKITEKLKKDPFRFDRPDRIPTLKESFKIHSEKFIEESAKDAESQDRLKKYNKK